MRGGWDLDALGKFFRRRRRRRRPPGVGGEFEGACPLKTLRGCLGGGAKPPSTTLRTLAHAETLAFPEIECTKTRNPQAAHLCAFVCFN